MTPTQSGALVMYGMAPCTPSQGRDVRLRRARSRRSAGPSGSAARPAPAWRSDQHRRGAVVVDGLEVSGMNTSGAHDEPDQPSSVPGLVLVPPGRAENTRCSSTRGDLADRAHSSTVVRAVGLADRLDRAPSCSSMGRRAASRAAPRHPAGPRSCPPTSRPLPTPRRRSRGARPCARSVDEPAVLLAVTHPSARPSARCRSGRRRLRGESRRPRSPPCSRHRAALRPAQSTTWTR